MATYCTIQFVLLAEATPTPSPGCQMVMDLWCNADVSCVSSCTAGGFKLPLVARFGLKSTEPENGVWRCYSPSALDKTERKYTGGPAFCSDHVELASVAAICNGSQPGPYPVPPSATPPAGSCASPLLGTLNTSVVMDSAADATHYRIPVVLAIPGTQTVVVLSENRPPGGGDSGRHKLALAR